MSKETKGSNSSRVISSYAGGLEANTLAMLDSIGAKDNRDANEDRLQYLEAVRAASLVPENGIPPTNKMYQAIFRILRFGRTLELITSSFQLLIQLHERFPWVYISDSADHLEIVDEAWSPFNFGSDVDFDEKETSVRSLFFQQLIQNMNKGGNESDESDLKILGNMLLFKYLVHVLKLDFTPRNQVYEETMNWSLLKESSLNQLLASRRVNFKLLMKDCVSTMCAPFDAGEKSISLVELHKGMLSAMNELLVMIMELDASKKKADLEGITNRGDGVRTPAMEIILDELTYDGYLLSNFLKVFDDPKWKLEVVLQYLTKYLPKPSVRTRRSNVPQAEDSNTLNGILKTISNGTNAKNITKKIGSYIVQLLIGHAFLARLTFINPNEGDSITEICNSIISAFTSLKRVDQKIDILPFGKEVLFTAEMVLKTKA
ncbi:Negative regulator of systemic acquired resistance SNI1 [Cardamine amara subsp. amara]|uniref:Negative regulator of systemic acquired resistance SNI1 n=1 Tax=Cardamine amara subsp. amara TaxID=228776 RepID=A0ABD1C0C8_CARAN